jgi:hypothetical protein
MRHTDHLMRRGSWVAERTEQIEDRAHAELGAHLSDVTHRRVMRARVHEPDAHFLDAARHLLRCELDPHAECLEHIGAAGLGSGRTVAVLGHRHIASRDHQRRRGRNVESVRAIAAGAAGVQDHRLGRELHGHRVLSHHSCSHCQNIRALATHAQSDQERADLRGCRLAL